MTDQAEPKAGIAAAIGGAGAAIGGATATVSDTDPVIGLVLAFSTGLVLSGGLFLLYDQLR